MGPEALEDYIEVVSILQKPGDIFINGTFVARVQAGLQSTKIPSESGQVNVQVKRQGEVVLKLIPPQKITDQVFRTDRLTYMYSTRFSEYFTKIYGEQLSAPQINDFVLE